MSEKLAELQKSVVDMVYPIGAIYMSVNSTSPASLFGGTWEQIKDTFLLSAGDTYTAGSTGGEATHTLTVNEMPSHNHSETINISNVGRKALGGGYTPGTDFYEILDSSIQGRSKSGGGATSTNYAGSGDTHNNMPPYLTVYMWKRTA